MMQNFKPTLVAFIDMTFDDIKDELALLDDMEDRYRALIDLGRALPQMPEALKTDATKVRGCSSQVWLHAQVQTDGTVHFYGDSDAHIVRGLVAVLLSLVQDRTPSDIADVDARAKLAQLGLAGHLSPTRTNGFASMAQRVRDDALHAMTAG
jgi:cysteine desulfuration protein SufE